MGWTYTTHTINPEAAKAQHEWEATRYGSDIKAELIAAEWHATTFYAIIRLSSETHERYKTPVTWLRTDIVDFSGGKFGYKDMGEEMGPNLDQRPTPAFAQLVYKHIPFAPSEYAKGFRKWANINFKDENQLALL